MPVQTVKILGEDSLFEKSTPVTQFEDGELCDLIQNMKDTMQQKGGVGIAAPQIACNKRIILFGFEKSERYPNEKPVPFTILINPEIEILTNEMVDGWEGCLSVPGLRGLVPRYTKIKYSGYNEQGVEFNCIAEGFHARIVQHEVDHLDGVLFPQRIKDLHYFGFEEVLKTKMIKQPEVL